MRGINQLRVKSLLITCVQQLLVCSGIETGGLDGSINRDRRSSASEIGPIAGLCAHDPNPIPPEFWKCCRWTRSPMLGTARA